MYITYLTIALLLGLANFQKPFPSGTVRHVFKIVYNGPNDSSRVLLNIQYLNSHNDIVRDIILQPDGKYDTCDMKLAYDQRGNKIRELCKCSDGEIVQSMTDSFSYNKSGKVITEIYHQETPFFDYYVKTHEKDSVIQILYSDRNDLHNHYPEKKIIEVLGKQDKVTLSFAIDSKGDTGDIHTYIYRSLSDTRKPVPAIDVNFGFYEKSIDTEIHYHNRFGKDEIINYLRNDTIEEQEIIKYNSQNKVQSDRYFSFPKDRYLSEELFYYDSHGNLIEKGENKFESGVTMRYLYKHGALIREEYIFDGTLNHAIEYVYK